MLCFNLFVFFKLFTLYSIKRLSCDRQRLDSESTADRQLPTATDSHSYRQRPTDRQTDRPTDRQTDRVSTDRQRSTGSTRSNCQVGLTEPDRARQQSRQRPTEVRQLSTDRGPTVVRQWSDRGPTEPDRARQIDSQGST